MSKRNSDGDVLTNQFGLLQASSKRRLAALLGPAPDSHTTSSINSEPDEYEDDLKDDFVDPEQLGIGGIRPKDFEGGGFTRRTLTSDDKFLAQLIGQKKAKAHIAARQQTARLGTQQQPKHGRQIVKKQEESEDEEEGRAAAFKSKRRKTVKAKPVPVTEDQSEDEQALPVQDHTDREENVEKEATEGPSAIEEADKEDQPVARPKSIPSRGKAKPKSYLDELLVERSKKKKKKVSVKAES